MWKQFGFLFAILTPDSENIDNMKNLRKTRILNFIVPNKVHLSSLEFQIT